MKKQFLVLLLLAACHREVPAPPPATGTSPPPQPALPQVAGPKLAFVDEAPRDPQLVAYRDRLLAAVRARDAKGVAALADPHIRTSFGDDGGSTALEQTLAQPGMFEELEWILMNGGSFREGSFWAPYVYSAFPDEHDGSQSLKGTKSQRELL